MLCHPQDASDCRSKTLPVSGFNLQLFASGSSQAIKPRTPAKLGNAPFSRNPALVLETVECRIKRALIHPEDLTGSLFD